MVGVRYFFRSRNGEQRKCEEGDGDGDGILLGERDSMRAHVALAFYRLKKKNGFEGGGALYISGNRRQ